MVIGLRGPRMVRCLRGPRMVRCATDASQERLLIRAGEGVCDAREHSGARDDGG
jgi:hypothetical protein